MKIKAVYDQIIRKPIHGRDGMVISCEPASHHYVFGELGDDISGGFYIKVGAETPPSLVITIDQKLIYDNALTLD
jgi:hypothetical protein